MIMNYCLLFVSFFIAGCTATIEYTDIIDTTHPETFLNLTFDDLNSTIDVEDVDIKQVIIKELARNEQRLDTHVLNFLDNPISESGKFEGDIELPPNAQINSSNPNYWNEAYAAIINSRRLWPGGVVPYQLSSHYGKYARAKFNQAFNDFKKFSCLKFVPHSVEVDYLIIKPKLGCGSQIGRMGGDQIVSLSAGCIQKTTIIHELMHALGFYHEHVRYDRDNHITVHWKNITQYPNILEQFQKQNASVMTLLGKPYDQTSIMHYDANAFARDPALITITANDGGNISNDHGFTHMDIEKLNELYKCYPGKHWTKNNSSESQSINQCQSDAPKIEQYSSDTKAESSDSDSESGSDDSESASEETDSETESEEVDSDRLSDCDYKPGMGEITTLTGVRLVTTENREKILVVTENSLAHPFTIMGESYSFNGDRWHCLFPVLLLTEAQLKKDEIAIDFIRKYQDSPKYLDDNCQVKPWTDKNLQDGFDFKLTYNTINDWMMYQASSATALLDVHSLYLSLKADRVVFLGKNANYFGARTLNEGASGISGRNLIGNEVVCGFIDRDEVEYVIPGYPPGSSDSETEHMDINSDDGVVTWDEILRDSN